MGMILMDDSNNIYDKIRKLRDGNESQRRLAVECEKILSDRVAGESLNDKLMKILKILDSYSKD